MVAVSLNTEASHHSLLDTAWLILEAANDLRDTATVETCRRVIDATLRGAVPEPSDIHGISDYF
jgi:hypothetical protein